MSSDEFNTLFPQLGLSRERAARLLSISRREIDRWAEGVADVPGLPALVIRMMVAKNVSADEAMSLRFPQDPSIRAEAE